MWWRGHPVKNRPSTTGASVEVVCYSGDPYLWDNYVDKHPAGTIYHRHDWRRVVEQTFGYECPYLAALRGVSIAGVLPLTIVKGPLFGTYIASCAFSDYGGICADDMTAARELLSEAVRIAMKHGAKFMELRHVLPVDATDMEISRNKVLSVLALPNSEEALWNFFSAKLRNQVRKSLKGGMNVRWGHDDLLADFHHVFSRNMRDLGTPALGIEYFRNILDFHGDAADVLILYKGSTPISGAVALTYRDTMEVPWASSIREYFSLLPNMLLYWTILKECIRRGLHNFSFGRSTEGSPTAKFKAQWNSEAVALNYQVASLDCQCRSDLTPMNPKYRLAVKTWKKLPLVVTRRLGPFVARQLA
jgi:FemAB-related protein (PEP-CTERM system-associated)